MNTSLQVFGSFTKEANSASKDKVGGDVAYLSKLPVGTTVLRLMPPAAGRDRPWVVVHQHFVRVPGADKPVVFNCPEKMKNERCPGCQQMRALEKTGNPVDFDAAKKYAPSFRVFANVIDRANPNDGPKVWGFGVSIFRRLTYFRDNDAAYGEDYTHPIEGRDLIITRTGTGPKDTRYQVDLSAKSTPLAATDEQMVEWAGRMADLDKSGYVPSWQEITEKVAKAKGLEPPASQPAIETQAVSTPSVDQVAADVAADDDIPF